jgi:hypothetical protein
VPQAAQELRRALVEAVDNDLLTLGERDRTGQYGRSQASSVVGGGTADDHGDLLRNAE